MKLTFKNAKLKTLIELTRKGKEFLIPYEGDKTTPKRSVFLVKDSGIYLMPCAKGYKAPADKSHIVYAEGKGENTHSGGDDYIESIELTDEDLKLIHDGWDMVIKITPNTLQMGFSKIQPKAVG